MSYAMDEYYRETAAQAAPSARATFIKRTYLHVAAAVLAFMGIEVALVASGVAEQVVKDLFLAGRGGWLAILVLFMVGSYAAQYMARSGQSVGVQYAGLAMYVLLEVVIFLPLLTLAALPQFGGGVVIYQAGLVTLAVFGGLTAAVFFSGKDFSFLGPVLWVGSMLALGLILASILFGFNLGLIFCAAMVGLMAVAIIYQTSNVMHHYGTNEHVAASLALFASIATLFWYVLQLFMSARND